MGTFLPAADLGAQAVTNPNQIVGTAGFTNTSNEFLEHLQQEPFSDLVIFANTVDHDPKLSHTTWEDQVAPLLPGYEITVESDPDGIAYSLSVTGRLDDGRDQYKFLRVETDPVVQEPAPDVVRDLRECGTVVQVRFLDCGRAATVQRTEIFAYKEGAFGTFTDQQAYARPRDPTDAESLIVRGDGQETMLSIYYEYGTDPYSDLVRYRREVFVDALCDQVLDVPVELNPDCAGGNGIPFGRIIGRVDMLGEEEHPIPRNLPWFHRTMMKADMGPFDNFRVDGLLRSPSSGDFELENLVPSDITFPSTGSYDGYRVWGELNFRRGRRFQYFRTPERSGNEREVLVLAGETVDLGDTYVMDPGWMSGDLLFAGRPGDAELGLGSCLHALARDSDPAYDTNGDGIPNDVDLDHSVVAAGGATSSGSGNNTVPGAYPGVAHAVFEGDFSFFPGRFDGDYELVLGGLNQESSMWRGSSLLLSFQDPEPAPGIMFQDSYISIYRPDYGPVEIVPGGRVDRHHAYCFSEVRLGYLSTSGTFYDPWIDDGSDGLFEGTDFRGVETGYNVSIKNASGVPRGRGSASDRGLVTLCLPQGRYDLEPRVRSVDPTTGGSSNTELPPVNLDVGCGQILNLLTDLQIALDPLPICGGGSQVLVSGSVTGEHPIDALTCAVNGEPLFDFCTDCGDDPTYSRQVALSACRNEIEVIARDRRGEEASARSVVRIDETPPVIDCPGDLVLEPTDKEACGVPASEVPLPRVARDGCDGEIPTVCDAPAFFGLGTTPVTCRAADGCNLEATCSLNVTVRDEPRTCNIAPSCEFTAALEPDGAISLESLASDPEGDALTPSWSLADCPRGSVVAGSAPGEARVLFEESCGGPCVVRHQVEDAFGGSSICERTVERPRIRADAGPGGQLSCEQTSLRLQASIEGGGGPGSTWSWAPGFGLDDPSVADPVATRPARYVLTARDGASGCLSVDYADVTTDTSALVEPSALDARPSAPPLRVSRPTGDAIRLEWEEGPGPGWNLHQGELEDLHQGIWRLSPLACGLEEPRVEKPVPEGSLFFLVVSRCAALESSYGRASDGEERRPTTDPCR